jgi:hypothetical protein
MYIRLIYTADKNLEQLLRTLAYIINTPTITSAGTLNTALSNTGIFASDIGSGFDSSNSEIIRTVNLSSTVAHIAKPAMSNTINFTLEQSVYDAPSTKYYYQINQINYSGAAPNVMMGNGLTGGTITSSQLPQTQASSSATAAGTLLSLVNSSFDYGQQQAIAGQTSWRALHVYITDKCFLWGISVAGGPTGVGWSGTYNNNGNYTVSGLGCWQYTRLDHWNTDANGIIPVAGARMTGVGSGIYSNSSHWTTVTNTSPSGGAYVNSYYNFLKVFNLINYNPTSTTGSFTREFNRYVAHGLGGIRTSETKGHTVSLDQSYTGMENAVTTNKSISVTAGEKVANATNTGMAFALLPLTWTMSGGSCWGGGDISAQSGFYIFNGEYAPGDTLTYSGKTFILWPTNLGPVTSRLAIAVPKE